MDLKESQYNEIGENVYDKIETELPLENKNVYEQLVADISLNEIGFVIIDKGKDNADGFKKELASLTRDEQFPCDTGKLSVNSEKNRFHSSLPYDHSRVILRRNVGTSDDYINANYISGAERKNEYIATQGPLKTTIVEFWEMVCQDQIQQIIMLTNLTEQGKVKCCQYWPMDGMTDIYGTVSVKSIEEKSFASFTKRKLEVSQRGIKTYELTQYHFTTWPDHGTPDPLCLVIFHHHVMHENINNGTSPILVHCSTGTGRTGAFIALDYLYKTGKISGRVNVAEYVKTMRKNRMNMIENYRQYQAVFLALHEAFKAEPVLQTKEEFLDTVSPMLKKATTTSSYFKREFELLKRICQVYADEDSKQGKSMQDAVLPLDKHKLYRPSNVPRRGSFVKAVVASTHTVENGFIITQYPPLEKAVDFLRLLIDHECSTIICLDPLHILDSTKSWMPSLSSEKIVPPYRVVCSSCKETDLKLSTISIQKDKGQPFNVLVAEPKSVLGSRTQNDTSTLCGLASFALSRPSNTTIAVVSRDGASLCGVFCAVFNSIQQITMDDNIDVFTTVRLLMNRRPELCSTEDEYRMTYQTIYDYLQRPSQNVYCNQ
ncbi:receptor-type tyrosine-protein phosphatase kappa-like [Crassostrea angulata]|uniref:receptor-type tyrosine-protein phosphatase kappa-like n=1 Tax=Magallana angulata TaxID=2784310 RepID=UPI0022B09A0E|nr:receptor-type tyrosine-protein phosphatase kappa-like [Crassostrea angulata]